MLLRRYLRHFRRHDWFAVGVDFLIVVVGVFLGIQAQQWNETRADRARERQLVAGMIEDIEIDRGEFANGIAVDLRRVAAANEALAMAGLAPIDWTGLSLPSDDGSRYTFENSMLPDLSPAERAGLWTSIALGYFPTPSTSTYDAMVGAGDMDLIRDADLLREIQLYRNRTETVEIQNDKLLDIRARVLDIGMAEGLALYGTDTPEAVAAIVRDNRPVEAALRTQAAITLYHYSDVVVADRQAAQLQTRLEAYLSP